MGVELTEEELQATFTELDKTNKGWIEEKEFIQLVEFGATFHKHNFST